METKTENEYHLYSTLENERDNTLTILDRLLYGLNVRITFVQVTSSLERSNY